MIQFITHHNQRFGYTEGARMALQGGCRWVQLRMKDADDDEFLAVAREIRSMCNDYGAKFILDDRVHLVKAAGADGVHLGKNDMPVGEARRALGPHYIIGGTANTFDDIRHLALNGADYIGCGPFRFTTTKKNLSPIIGLSGYRQITKQMGEAGIHLPIVAIGGILAEDVEAVMQTGVTGIAVSGAILNADNPVAEMEKWTRLLAAE